MFTILYSVNLMQNSMIVELYSYKLMNLVYSLQLELGKNISPTIINAQDIALTVFED